MIDTKHTPGPWEVHQEAEGRNSVRICKPDAGCERGCQAVAEAEILGMPRLEAEGNARLIAAASRRWNRMTSDQRYELLRRWYPDCWAINSMSLKKWEQMPPSFRAILRTNP